MPCNCGKKHKSEDAQFEQQRVSSVEKVVVYCPDCDTNLIGVNGMSYPVHVTTVLVRRSQYNAWVEEGYPVQLYEDQPVFA